MFSYGIILCEIIARVQADPDFLPRTENFGLDYHTFQHMVGDCPHNFLQLAFNCCNMDPTLRPSFPEIVRTLEGIQARLKLEQDSDSVTADNDKKTPNKSEKVQGFKRPNLLGFPDDKIPPKSPRPRRNIWLSRSQSDVFSSCKPGRKLNVQDPFYQHPPLNQKTAKSHKVNPFTAREDLCGGKIKFFDVPSKSVFSLVFDLHSPPGSVFCKQLASMNGSTVMEEAYSWQQLPGRQCHSVPVSPQMPRSFHLPTVVSSNNGAGAVTCDGNQPQAAVNSKAEPAPGCEARPKAAVSSWARKYVVVEIPPFCRRRGEPGDREGEAEGGSTENMDCSGLDHSDKPV